MDKMTTSKLEGVFLKLRDEKEEFLGARTGAEFEDRLKIQMDKAGLNRILRSDISAQEMGQLKKRMDFFPSDMEQQNRNPLVGRFENHYMHQPRGRQDYPDFVVFEGNRCICIETKFSKDKKGKPVWNSGLPRQCGLYVFAAYGSRDLTFFRGGDVVSVEDALRMHEKFTQFAELASEFNRTHLALQEYGFEIYVRKAFQQSRQSNKNAELSYFANPNRSTLEESALRFIRNADSCDGESALDKPSITAPSALL